MIVTFSVPLQKDPNDDPHNLHGQPDHRGLEPQAKERPQVHALQGAELEAVLGAAAEP